MIFPTTHVWDVVEIEQCKVIHFGFCYPVGDYINTSIIQTCFYIKNDA